MLKTFEGSIGSNISRILEHYLNFTELQHKAAGMKNARPISTVPELKKKTTKPPSDFYFGSILLCWEKQNNGEARVTREEILASSRKHLKCWQQIYPEHFKDYLEWYSEFAETVDARLRTLTRRKVIEKDGEGIYKLTIDSIPKQLLKRFKAHLDIEPSINNNLPRIFVGGLTGKIRYQLY